MAQSINSQQKIDYCLATLENLERWMNQSALHMDNVTAIDTAAKMASLGRLHNNMAIITADINRVSVETAKILSGFLEIQTHKHATGDALIQAAKRLIPVADGVIAKKRDFPLVSAAELEGRGLEEDYNDATREKINDEIDQFIKLRRNMIDELADETNARVRADSEVAFKNIGISLEEFSNSLVDLFAKLVESMNAADLQLNKQEELANELTAQLKQKNEISAQKVDISGADMDV